MDVLWWPFHSVPTCNLVIWWFQNFTVFIWKCLPYSVHQNYSSQCPFYGEVAICCNKFEACYMEGCQQHRREKTSPLPPSIFCQMYTSLIRLAIIDLFSWPRLLELRLIEIIWSALHVVDVCARLFLWQISDAVSYFFDHILPSCIRKIINRVIIWSFLFSTFNVVCNFAVFTCPTLLPFYVACHFSRGSHRKLFYTLFCLNFSSLLSIGKGTEVPRWVVGWWWIIKKWMSLDSSNIWSFIL